MIERLVDHVNVIYVLLGLVFLGCGLLFWQTRRVRELLAMAIIAAVGLLVWYLCSLVMTDRKQIEANMHTLANTCLNGQPERMASFLADRKYGGKSRTQVAEEVTQLAKSHGINDYRISGFRVEQLTRDGNKGRAEATFMLRIDTTDRPSLLRCWATFVFEGGKWCLESFAYSLNPLGDESEKRPASMYTPDR